MSDDDRFERAAETERKTGEGDRPPLADQRDVEQVYQPAEDSRLLAETAGARIESGDRVLDVGTGSGYVADHVRSETGATVVGVDLNPHACRQAAEAGVPVVRGDLSTPFRANVFDAVCFNPPYLPTDPDAEWGDWMEAALSGGDDGRAAIEPFLADVGRVLAPDGVAYLLISTLTDPDAVRETAAAHGLTAERIESESYPFEQLLVLGLSPTRA